MPQANGGYPDFNDGMTIFDQSAQKMQTMSNSSRSAFDQVGPGLKHTGKVVSLRVPPKQGALSTLLIVAVVVKPTPAQHTLTVREVAIQDEGRDFVMPNPPPEPTPTVAPTSATLQWKGPRIEALPGYTKSVADFASTWFSDILRDDAGEPILADGKTVEALPDDTVTLHWLYLRPQGPPVLVMMGGGAGNVVQQFLIMAVTPLFLICKMWDGETEGTQVNVWKPWTLRVSLEPYTIDGVTYSGLGAQRRSVQLPSGIWEQQVTTKAYRDRDILYGTFKPVGGIASHLPQDNYANVPGAEWLDDNRDGRAWAKAEGT